MGERWNTFKWLNQVQLPRIQHSVVSYFAELYNHPSEYYISPQIKWQFIQLIRAFKKYTSKLFFRSEASIDIMSLVVWCQSSFSKGWDIYHHGYNTALRYSGWGWSPLKETKVRHNRKWPQFPFLRSDVLFIRPDHLPMWTLSLNSNIFLLCSCHDYNGRWRALSLELGQMPFWGICIIVLPRRAVSYYPLPHQHCHLPLSLNTGLHQTVMCKVSPPFAGVYLSASSWSSPCKSFGYLGSFSNFVHANLDKVINAWWYVSACGMETCWAVSLVVASG